MSKKIPLIEKGQHWRHKTHKRRCTIIFNDRHTVIILWGYPLRKTCKNDARKWDEFEPDYFLRYFRYDD